MQAGSNVAGADLVEVCDGKQSSMSSELWMRGKRDSVVAKSVCIAR